MPRIQDDDFSVKLGNRILARRNWLELSQRALAKRVGVSAPQLQKYEWGEDHPRALTVVKLATALGMTAAELLGESKRGPDSQAHLDELAALLSDPTFGAIIRRLRALDQDARERIHAWIISTTLDRTA